MNGPEEDSESKSLSPEEAKRRLALLREDSIRVAAFRHTLNNESDRGVALMAPAFLDVELVAAIRAVVIDDRKVQDRLLGRDGAAGTFSARIDLGYLLGIVSKEFRSDLHIIRRIRNDFAHDPAPMSLDAKGIADRIRNLSWCGDDVEDRPRAKFIRSSLGTLTELHTAGVILGRLKPRLRPSYDKEQMGKLMDSSIASITRELLSGELDMSNHEQVVDRLLEGLVDLPPEDDPGKNNDADCG